MTQLVALKKTNIMGDNNSLSQEKSTYQKPGNCSKHSLNIFLVGGAVRDKLLKYPVKEQDWVVIGTSPQQMLEQGFTQVGKDFPVFLHPDTKEEYALARTERKSGQGYYGFDINANKNITLEEDLKRRDLTINAMAMDQQGQIIDPYNGQSDLRNSRINAANCSNGRNKNTAR